MNSVAYMGAAYGNLAWLDWRDQQFDQAERQAQKALSVWGDYQYPFKWLATLGFTWPSTLIASSLIKPSSLLYILLDPKQQRLPDDLTAALEQSVLSWEENQVNKTQDALNKAVELAQKWGYL